VKQAKEIAKMGHGNHVETIIIGGGQAGISVSYQLKLQGRDHIVLEQAAQAANAWRNHRWESFSLSTPNWQSQLPGAPLPGANPDGFSGRDEVVRYFEEYIRKNRIPIRYGVRVLAVKMHDEFFVVETTAGRFTSKNVVVATGICQKPDIPEFRGALSPEILELHSDSYRKPSHLPFGAVLVVGSGQSGAQIAEDLYLNGRTVYLSVSRSGRVPRRYRGKDINWWSNALGLYEHTANDLKSPRDKFASKSHISGTMGGHTLNLHQFAADGVNLLGRVTGLKDNTVFLAHDLHKNLAAADQLEANLTALIDNFIGRRGLNFPKEALLRLTAGFDQPERESLDLKRAGVTSVIWATGYSFDFSVVRLPVFDADGYPVQQRGVTSCPGLFFVGLPWLHNARSGLFFGLKEESEYIAAQIAERQIWDLTRSPGINRAFSCPL
jgi:putative flavoprotein involved in K+ transport